MDDIELKEVANQIYKMLKEPNSKAQAEKRINALFLDYKQRKAEGENIEDIQSRSILILANQQLVNYVANKYFKFGDQDAFQNYCSEGLYALVSAVDHYDVDRGTSFAGYATQSIKNEISRALLRDKMRVETISFQELAEKYRGDDRVMELADDTELCREVDKLVDDEQFLRLLKLYLTKLKPIEQYLVVEKLSVFGATAKSFTDVCNAFDVPRATLFFYYKQGITKLAYLLGKKKKLGQTQMKHLNNTSNPLPINADGTLDLQELKRRAVEYLQETSRKRKMSSSVKE